MAPAATAEQALLIQAPPSAVVISSAGAGAGKTWTLAERISHAVREHGVCPSEIYALTFTNIAVAAMQHALAKTEAREARVMTMHAMATLIMGLPPATPTTRELCIEHATERLEDPAFVLPEPVAMVLVDEVQDNNEEQHVFVQALVANAQGRGPCGLTLVGDERQAIYSFRGGAPRGLTEAATLYRSVGYEVVEAPLTHNFRSTPEIVAACNALYRTTSHRPMRAVRPSGPRPRLVGYHTVDEEIGALCVNVVASLRAGRAPTSHLVLCRTNQQAVEVVSELRAARVTADKTAGDFTGSGVRVSTVHGEKGGEADYVFAMGLSDAVYPCAEALSDSLGAEEAVLRAIENARAAINVTVSRARCEFVGSFAIHQAGGRLVGPSRLLEDLSLWSVVAPVGYPLASLPRASFDRGSARSTLRLEALQGYMSAAERHVMGHADTQCHKMAVAEPPDDALAECMGISEVVASVALGHCLPKAMSNFVTVARGPLRRPACGGVLQRLKKAMATAERSEDAAWIMGTAAGWARGAYHDNGPLDVARTEALGFEGRLTEAGAWLRDAARRVVERCGPMRSVNSGEAKVRDILGRRDRLRIVTSRQWVEHELDGTPTLLTVCTAKQDPSDALVAGTMLLAAQFVGSSRGEDVADFTVSVSVWDAEAGELHRLDTSLACAVDSLHRAYAGLVHGAMQPPGGEMVAPSLAPW